MSLLDNGRPNTPINVMVRASIIKELLDYSDDDIVEEAFVLSLSSINHVKTL